jgi:hypothetical protein
MERSWIWVLSVIAGSLLFLMLGFGSMPCCFFLSYLLTSRLVRCRVQFLSLCFHLSTCFLSLSFFLSFFFFLHVRVTIFDVSWCHVRQSRKITITTLECKMILNTRVTIMNTGLWLERDTMLTCGLSLNIKLNVHVMHANRRYLFHV